MSKKFNAVTELTIKVINDLGCNSEDLLESSKEREACLNGVCSASSELSREILDITEDDEKVAIHFVKKIKLSQDQLMYQRGFSAGIKSIVDMLNKKKENLIAVIGSDNVGVHPSERKDNMSERMPSKTDETEE